MKFLQSPAVIHPHYANAPYAESKPETASGANPNAGNDKGQREPSVASKMAESAATTFASILVLGLGFAAAGYIYHRSYKMLVVNKMVRAFEPGDPVLDLAAVAKDMPSHRETSEERWVHRDEQTIVDAIVDGRDVGHYFLMIGDKGTGKSSMLLEAMRKIDGDGVSMFEAHADLEVVRLRLGKALNYEYHEDYIGGYFSERGPRESTALLDIERALNKLEKVAMKLIEKRKKPLILIVNQMHLLRDDDDGRDLIELLQQRAEQWAATNLVTMVFNSDDYWVYERLKQLATRMEVLPITDLPKAQAVDALKKYRQRYWGESLDMERLEQVYDRVGGRLSFLNKVAKSKDMLATCESIQDIEKKWFLNQCWILGMEMDDDVMDQQKWAAAAMVLAQALVAKEKDMELIYDPVVGHLLPSYPFHIAQELMTRCDFIRKLDSLNLFSITSKADVRASSVPMHRAFQEICSQPGFDKHLELTIQRIADIESLGRTRELVAKDLVLGGHYEIEAGRKGITVRIKEAENKDDLLSLVRTQSSPAKADVSTKKDKHRARRQREAEQIDRDDDTMAMASQELPPLPNDDGASDVEVDFGALEVFDSNAATIPSSQAVEPTSSKKKRRDKKRDRNELSSASKSQKRASRHSSSINGHDDAEERADVTPASLSKKKRKNSDSSDGKERKKRKAHAAIDMIAEEQAQPEVPSSPTAARSHRKGLSSNLADADDVEAAEMERDVAAMARQAWQEHINTQASQQPDAEMTDAASIGAEVQAETQAEVPTNATFEAAAEAPADEVTSPPRRPLSTRKKSKPTYFDQPFTDASLKAFEQLPSPSAMTPKPRRTKKATSKKGPRRQRKAGREADLYSDEAPRASYTEGKFSEEELSRVAHAIESFRVENNLEQSDVNDMIQKPGGTSAGEAHAQLWLRIFAECPDRRRQKVINVCRKKFHNFVARGTWTWEQDIELSGLINLHGKKWSYIAGLINRHPEDIRDRYRNYLICAGAQKREAWTEDEEARLTRFVQESMKLVDDVRAIDPVKEEELRGKSYEELIDWQSISVQMERTRSRLQCITKWKAMNLRINAQDKLASADPDSSISFRLEKARRQLEDMPDTEKFRMVLAIKSVSASTAARIPWQKLCDKKFRNTWHRSTQELVWNRLVKSVPGSQMMTARDCAQYLADKYSQEGGLPDISGGGWDDEEEMTLISQISSRNKEFRQGVSKEKLTQEDMRGDEDELADEIQEIQIDPALDALAEVPQSAQKATPAKRTQNGKRPLARKPKRRVEPIEESADIVADAEEADGDDIDESSHRKRKTPTKFKDSRADTAPSSDMDDMEDVPARVD
ncbi:RNA polymerase I termination factor [Beauveria bassiana]|nr:RNA polymerase I termination factor [Beauveria bassiana]